MERYSELSYRELQAKAKELGIAANKSREALLDAIFIAEESLYSSASKLPGVPFLVTIDRNLILEVKKKDKSENILHNGKYELSLVTQLDLHLKEEDGREVRKIRTIENLVELVPNVEILSLSYNAITTIQGLNGLSKLITLNLAENDIEVLDINALCHLSSLEKLNLSGNKIKRIPSDIYRLSLLTDLKLARNKLEVLKDLNHLVNLPFMVNLTAEDNDFYDETGRRVTPHEYRMYVVFLLTTLQKLDGSAVTATQRNQAKQLFGSDKNIPQQQQQQQNRNELIPTPKSPPPPIQNRSYSATFTPMRPHSPSLLPQSANKAMNEYQQRIEKLSIKLLEADQENKLIQNKLDQMTIMQKHHVDNSAEVKEWKTKYEQCEAKLNEVLLREQETKASLTLEVTMAREEVEKQILINKKLENENQELTALSERTMEEIKALRSHILNGKVSITDTAVKSLSSIDDWKSYATRMDIAAQRTDYEELKAFNNRMRSELEESLAQLSESNAKLIESRSEIEELKLKNTSLQESVTVARNEISELREKDRKSITTIQRLRENKNTLENERIHYKILSEQLEADMTTYLNAASQKKVMTPSKLKTTSTLLDQRIFPQQQQLNQELHHHHQQQSRMKTPSQKYNPSQDLADNNNNKTYFEAASSTDSEDLQDVGNTSSGGIKQTIQQRNASFSRSQRSALNQSVLATPEIGRAHV